MYDIVFSQGTQYPARGCVPTRRRRPVQIFDLHNPLLFEILTDSFLWCGGVWNWCDLLTLIQAMAVVDRARQDVKLLRGPGGVPALF